jgi:hypothetical protein
MNAEEPSKLLTCNSAKRKTPVTTKYITRAFAWRFLLHGDGRSDFGLISFGNLFSFGPCVQIERDNDGYRANNLSHHLSCLARLLVTCPAIMAATFCPTLNVASRLLAGCNIGYYDALQFDICMAHQANASRCGSIVGLTTLASEACAGVLCRNSKPDSV